MNHQKQHSLISIQILRGLAAWLVVFHHLMQRLFDFDTSTSIGWFFSKHGAFGVDIFFVISGFIMYYTVTLKDYAPKEFYVNRIKRVVPAYWFFTFVLVAIAAFYPAFTKSQWTLDTLIASLLFIPTQNPGGLGRLPFLTVGWTLNFEMFFYGLLAFIMLTTTRRRFLICGIVLLSLPMIWKNNWLYGAVLHSPKLAEFAFGIFIGHCYLKYNRSLFNGSLAIALCTLTIGLLLMAIKSRELASAFIVLAFITANDHIAKLGKMTILRYLGNTSYSVYLCHSIILGCYFHLLGSPDSALSLAGALVTVTGAILLTSHLSFTYIESNRWVELFRRPKNNKTDYNCTELTAKAK